MTPPSAPPRQTLVIEGFPRPEAARALSPNGRAHWATRRKHRLAIEQQVFVSAHNQRLKPMRGFVTMQPIYIVKERRARDDDNFATGVLKVCRDTLVRARFLEADDTDHLRQLPVEIRVEKGRRALVLEFSVEQGAA